MTTAACALKGGLNRFVKCELQRPVGHEPQTGRQPAVETVHALLAGNGNEPIDKAKIRSPGSSARDGLLSVVMVMVGMMMLLLMVVGCLQLQADLDHPDGIGGDRRDDACSNAREQMGNR